MPAPSLAARARAVIEGARVGALATLSTRSPGHPFASLMPYALGPGGRPVVLVSNLAVHTRNLEADARASLLVAEPHVDGEAPAAARVTLMGTARRLAPAEVDGARRVYLARHPEAAAWADLGDFAFWGLDPADVYVVAGFGVMGWVDVEAYAATA
jgi:putative heme iron utilization protein